MKVTADASALKKALDLLRPGSTRFHALPAERCVRIKARGKGVLEMATTDLSHWEVFRVLNQQVENAGTVLVPWTQFRKVVGVLKGEEVTLEGSKGTVTITSGEVVMKITLPKVQKEDDATFPALPVRPVDALPVRLHLGALAEVAKFSSPDYSRPTLGCVYYDGGSYVSTDSYRLSIVEIPEAAADLQFLIPANAHKAVTRMGAPKWVDAWVSPDPKGHEAMIWFDLGDASVVAKLDTGGYPNYSALITDAMSRTGGSLKATQEFRDAALRIYRLTKAMSSSGWEYASPVKIKESGGKVVLSAKVGNNTIKIKAIGKASVPVAFNTRYLAELFEGTSVDTMFGADSIKSWGLTEDADYCSGARRTRLLMPARVHNDW